MKQPSSTRSHRALLAIVAASAAALGACAALNDAMQQAQMGGPGGSSAPSAEPAPAGDTPAGGDAKKPEGGGSGGKTYCCVGPDKASMSFYDCKTPENTVKCIGNPFEISPCAQKCSGPDSQKCTMKCMEDYGPNPERGHCKLDASRNKECKQ